MGNEYIHKWEETTEDLYAKIKPIGGKVFSKISHGFKRRNWIDNIWIEIYMNDFIYIDPFYGEQKANSNFETFFEIYDIITDLKFDSILQLANLEFDGGGEFINGSFSNSLDMLVTKLKFGEIHDWKIPIEIEYSLANSDSYGYMTGTVKDHLTKSSRISTELIINELELECLNEQNPFDQAKHLNWKVYNPKSIRLATDLKWSAEHSKGYYIPYRNENEIDEVENPYPYRTRDETKKGKSKIWKFWK